MGPPPHNSVHRIRSSLLADPACTSFRAGLTLMFSAPEQGTRVDRAWGLLAEIGLTDPIQLRGRIAIPAGRWLCRVIADTGLDELSEQMTPLQAALILGLCGPSFYAEDRPLIWSEARLARTLTLHATRDFYEEVP